MITENIFLTHFILIIPIVSEPRSGRTGWSQKGTTWLPLLSIVSRRRVGATVGRPGPEVTKGPCYIGWSVCHLTDQVVTTWYEGSQWGTNGSFSRRSLSPTGSFRFQGIRLHGEPDRREGEPRRQTVGMSWTWLTRVLQNWMRWTRVRTSSWPPPWVTDVEPEKRRLEWTRRIWVSLFSLSSSWVGWYELSQDGPLLAFTIPSS